MKTIKQIILLLCIFNLTVLSAQTSKTYNGPYVMAGNQLRGDVVYSYKDGEDGERIKNGKFIFKSVPNGGNITVSGSYNNGTKNGKWTTRTMRGKSYIRPSRQDTNIDALKGEGLSIMSGNYVDGKRDGEWSFISGKAADGVSKSSIKSITNFSDGLLNGSFSYNLNDPLCSYDLYSFSIIGTFTKGMMDGKWILKYKNSTKIEFVRTMIFEDGRLISTKLIDTSTGAVATIDNDADRYKGHIIDPTVTNLQEVCIYSYFRMFKEPISKLFLPWMGDPTLERYDSFGGENMKLSPGFAKIKLNS